MIENDELGSLADRARTGKFPIIDFVVTGAPKAGTTFVHELLARHPQVVMSAIKETNYFSGITESKRTRRISRYSDYLATFKLKEGVRMVGETSPSYFYSPDTPLRLQRYNPNIKVVVCLRHPVLRALSHYHMDVDRFGMRLRPFVDVMSAPSSEEAAWGLGLTSYRDLSFYGSFAQKYVEVFGRERVLWVFFEEMIKDPHADASRICEFLGVEPFQSLPPDIPRNAHVRPRSKVLVRMLHSSAGGLLRQLAPAKLKGLVKERLLYSESKYDALAPEELRRLTREIYEDDIRKLESIVGRPLAMWR